MKVLSIFALLAMLGMSACSSVPDAIKSTDRDSAERAKANAEKAYEELDRDIK